MLIATQGTRQFGKTKTSNMETLTSNGVSIIFWLERIYELDMNQKTHAKL